MTPRRPDDKRPKIALPPEDHAEIVRLAQEADRTFAAEIRRAVRFYLQALKEGSAA